jgi:hypothetical protein
VKGAQPPLGVIKQREEGEREEEREEGEEKGKGRDSIMSLLS